MKQKRGANMNYMVESNIEWYAEQREKLVEHIDKINSESKKMMEEEKGLWVGMLTNDPDHWAEYGVHTVSELENYLDAEASR